MLSALVLALSLTPVGLGIVNVHVRSHNTRLQANVVLETDTVHVWIYRI